MSRRVELEMSASSVRNARLHIFSGGRLRQWRDLKNGSVQVDPSRLAGVRPLGLDGRGHQKHDRH
jgi:hypothetical protein